MQQKIEIGTVNDNGKQPLEQKVVSNSQVLDKERKRITKQFETNKIAIHYRHQQSFRISNSKICSKANQFLELKMKKSDQ